MCGVKVCEMMVCDIPQTSATFLCHLLSSLRIVRCSIEHRLHRSAIFRFQSLHYVIDILIVGYYTPILYNHLLSALSLTLPERDKHCERAIVERHTHRERTLDICSLFHCFSTLVIAFRPKVQSVVNRLRNTQTESEK